jgi:alpha-1,6-mannosyltransferase
VSKQKVLTRNIVILPAFLLMIVGHIWIAYFLKRESTYILFSVFAFLFASYYIICKQNLSTIQIKVLIGGAILLRLIWLPAFPHLSDDYARFVWDGRLSISGYNPFKYLPLQIMKQGYPSICIDSALYNAMNSQTYYTCYPPFLQLCFAIAAGIFPHNIEGSVVILRLLNLLADTGTVLLLIALCKKWNINGKLVLLYALNPMVIAELTGNLHFEAIMTFFLLATVWCWETNRFFLSIPMFGAAIVTKLVPLMLLPFIFFYLKGRKGWVFCIGAMALTFGSFLPFTNLSVIHKFWTSIDSYFQESEYNASIYYLVRDIVYYYSHENKIEIIGPVLTMLSGLVIVGYAIVQRNIKATSTMFKTFTWTLMCYYLFTTTVFPWYITPMVAFAVFTGFTFPIVWSAVVLLSYYTDHTPAFRESYMLIWIEYLLVAFAALKDLYRMNKKNDLFFKH